MAKERFLIREASQFTEATKYNASEGKLTIRVIAPGLSKNRRYYGESLLKSSYGIFEGAKMFADHQTDSEDRARPEGSVNSWVALLDKPWCESDGTVKATATVIDPNFKNKLDLLNKAGKLSSMGISIRAFGEASKGEYMGEACTVVESLVGCKSVDFVTFPAAGGLVETMESVHDVDFPGIPDQMRNVIEQEKAYLAMGLSAQEAAFAARIN